ncbi:predicted protein [Postia placenta Mad-698-R]|uniref:DUF6534 domain-containing protein n=1 Tax=Postia placenta MAD-698-R-SB12 TaxID=670580 RepID=A0A1X6MXE4_9APHY|nr:hypothetical protein POSPLADRAFT_1047230 [Postia placenta MAD-698-R-SB12]EED84987.1 predicted protein [Postia placenta Mad-698-R]OSX60912.1 hypothetical protein POSPLADRAFT_1047230 [Postia placenta MAD-698-R-SB12]
MHSEKLKNRALRTSLWIQLVGSFFNWGLQGLLFLQLFYLTFLAELLQTIFQSAGVYAQLIIVYLPPGDATLDLLTYGMPIMSVIISVALPILNQNMTLIASVGQLSLGQATAGLISTVMSGSQSGSVWLSGSALVDIIIAISMALLLHRHKTGHGHTDALLNRLIVYVVESGAVTASVAVLALVFFIRDKVVLQRYEDKYKGVQGPALPILLCDLPYANAAFISLNNRKRLRTSPTSTRMTLTMESHEMRDQLASGELRVAPHDLQSKGTGSVNYPPQSPLVINVHREVATARFGDDASVVDVKFRERGSDTV